MVPHVVVESFPGSTFSWLNRMYEFTDTVHSSQDNALKHALRLIKFKRLWVNAIILKDTSKAKPLFYVYIARKDAEKISIDEAVKIGYDVHPLDRRVYIRSMYDAGNRGIQDMSKFSRQFVVQPKGTTLTSDDISADHDIIGFDHPRMDIFTAKTKSGKVIRTGGNTFSERSILSIAAGEVLNKNFTRDEVRKMNLYFEANTPLPRGVVGTHNFHQGKGKPVSTISVGQNEITESTVTHEIVHALRNVDGRRGVADRDLDEIATEYEATLRVQKPKTSALGYYQFMPEFCFACEAHDAMLADRMLATGATDKPLKGRRLTHDIVPNTIRNSRIATAQPALRKHFAEQQGGQQRMIAEDVDTYFHIRLPDKTTSEYHIRFTRARPPLKKIKKHLKDRFGKNIEAWEWHDGKKVRLISRPKKTRSRKRTTKATTPARKRTPARNPVAAKRYGLDAILGVPEGLLW